MGVRPQWFALVLAVAAVMACCAWAPWMLVDAAFPDNHVSLGFAPLWSSKFGDLPGARVDVHQLLSETEEIVRSVGTSKRVGIFFEKEAENPFVSA